MSKGQRLFSLQFFFSFSLYLLRNFLKSFIFLLFISFLSFFFIYISIRSNASWILEIWLQAIPFCFFQFCFLTLYMCACNKDVLQVWRYFEMYLRCKFVGFGARILIYWNHILCFSILDQLCVSLFGSNLYRISKKQINQLCTARFPQQGFVVLNSDPPPHRLLFHPHHIQIIVFIIKVDFSFTFWLHSFIFFQLLIHYPHALLYIYIYMLGCILKCFV